jgi:glutamate racemase
VSERGEPDAPIGVFDSGIGGLTVLRALLERLPAESFVYFGDTARVPYGNRSAQTVTKYALETTLFLLQKGVKAMVVACNTVSATCLDLLSTSFRAPVIGVIEPCAAEAVRHTRSGHVAVIGTAGTIASGAYERELRAHDAGLRITTVACPLFVPLVEEGYTEHAMTGLAVREYLAPLKGTDIDTLILGCTHYPFLRAAIAGYLGPQVQLVDSGPATADHLQRLLRERDLVTRATSPGNVTYYLSDFQPRFRPLGERFLGRAVEPLEVVSI